MHNFIRLDQSCSTSRLLFFPQLAMRTDKISRLFLGCTALMFAMIPLLLSVNILDTRVLDGMPIWHKPIRFSISLMLHFLTLLILCQLITAKLCAKYRFSFFAYAAAASLCFEFIYIVLQAARGRRSHFNFETQIENIMYGLMGVGALFLVLVSFGLGIMILKYASNNLPGLRTGAVIGLILGSVLTLFYAGFMSSNVAYIGHRLGEEAQVVPYLGWSRVSGDYKPAHFIATHMMQILPLIGYCADKSNIFSKKGNIVNAKNIVYLGASVLTLLSIAVFIQAFNGIPLFKA